MVQLSHKVWGGQRGGRAQTVAGEDAMEDAMEDAHGCGWAQMLLCADETSFAKQVWLRESEGVYLAVGFLAGPRDAALAESLTTEQEPPPTPAPTPPRPPPDPPPTPP